MTTKNKQETDRGIKELGNLGENSQMLHGIMSTLEKARIVQERTAKRLEELIVPDTNGFTIETNKSPVHVERVYESKEAQVLYLKLPPNTTCANHKHDKSAQTCMVTKGVITCNSISYAEGDIFTVPPVKKHLIGTDDTGGKCLLILIPPEKFYKFKWTRR